MCLGTFSRRARSLATYFFFARVRIRAERFLLDRKCNVISYQVKIESCNAGFSACGWSRSDKFFSAAVRSTRSAFLLDRKCNVISYQAKKAAQTRNFPVRTAFSSFHTNIFICLHSSALMAMPAELRRLKYFRL